MIMKTIPVHQLKSRVSSGIEIKHFTPDYMPKDDETLGAHRDDHYLFFLLEGGTAGLMIDFKELQFKEGSLYYVLPGQVHHRIDHSIATGWFIAVDTLLIPPECRDVFENKILLQLPVVLQEQPFTQCRQLLNLLYAKYSEHNDNNFNMPVIYSLLQAFLGIAAGYFNEEGQPGAVASRPAALAGQFKKLLIQHLATHKSPSAYAEMMNVSEGYLNEVLKKITGFSVSQLILTEIMLEAKRLLYYSKLNVKQISHTLGYQDHTYFSRIFKKAENITPLGFRSKYLK